MLATLKNIYNNICNSRKQACCRQAVFAKKRSDSCDLNINSKALYLWTDKSGNELKREVVTASKGKAWVTPN